jgi:fido (protein-threonine AMPylation protein)
LGLLVSSPQESCKGQLDYDITLPFVPSQRLFYAFFLESPGSPDRIPVNLSDDVISLQSTGKTASEIRLSLLIQDEGDIEPTFHFQIRGAPQSKRHYQTPVPAIRADNLLVERGDVFVGVDFGHSYSYVTKLLEVSEKRPDFSFPQYEYTHQDKARLSALNEQMEKLLRDEILTESSVLRQAKRQLLNAVFHSNKIEGVNLSLGETQEAISRGHAEAETPDQKAAVNLQEAYLWILDNANAYQAQPEVFIRTINQMLLRDLHGRAGQYRDGQVQISGLDWSPPPPTSVPPLMKELATELTTGPRNRSVLEFAAGIHTKLVTIHPFFDGNGRTARLLLNAILVGRGWPAIIVRFDDRPRYLLALEDSNKGSISTLLSLFGDLCEGEIADIVSYHEKTEARTPILLDASQTGATTAVDEGRIQEVLAKINLATVADPLAEALRLRREAQRAFFRRGYETWAGKWLNFLTEVKNFASEVGQAPQYADGGVDIKMHDFGIVTFESFSTCVKGISSNSHGFSHSTFFQRPAKKHSYSVSTRKVTGKASHLAAQGPT